MGAFQCFRCQVTDHNMDVTIAHIHTNTLPLKSYVVNGRNHRHCNVPIKDCPHFVFVCLSVCSPICSLWALLLNFQIKVSGVVIMNDLWVTCKVMTTVASTWYHFFLFCFASLSFHLTQRPYVVVECGNYFPKSWIIEFSLFCSVFGNIYSLKHTFFLLPRHTNINIHHPLIMELIDSIFSPSLMFFCIFFAL